MRPIPAAAMEVVRILRRDVPRPKELPKMDTNLKYLRWPDGECAAGLHPASKLKTPSLSYSFAHGECSDQAVYEFTKWWDHLALADAPAAMDLIWPEEKT